MVVSAAEFTKCDGVEFWPHDLNAWLILALVFSPTCCNEELTCIRLSFWDECVQIAGPKLGVTFSCLCEQGYDTSFIAPDSSSYGMLQEIHDVHSMLRLLPPESPTPKSTPESSNCKLQ